MSENTKATAVKNLRVHSGLKAGKGPIEIAAPAPTPKTKGPLPH